ncbi:hypothetical protein B0H10DRAFT_1782992, partial [Mycena sp. CBHHK59/15]
KRQRASKSQPLFGKVQGAYRGADTLEIVRTREIKPFIQDRHKCSKEFLRKTHEIIERCESLSNETSCWLFITAQHVNALQPFMHYSSPRILWDAQEDVEEITNRFNRLFRDLLAVRQKEAHDLHKKLRLADARNSATEEALQSTSRELENLNRELEELRKTAEEQHRMLENYKLSLSLSG